MNVFYVLRFDVHYFRVDSSQCENRGSVSTIQHEQHGEQKKLGVAPGLVSALLSYPGHCLW